MYRFTTALLLLLAALCPQGASAALRWLETTHDFGAFNEGDSLAAAQFRFVNDSPEPVAITSVRVTCGCTTPVYSTDPILPGDTATIAISYDSNGRPGKFSKKIYVRTSASDDRTTLVIKGVALGKESTISGRFPVEAGKLRLRTGAMLLGKLTKGRARMDHLDGYNPTFDTIAPQVAYRPDFVDVAVVRERLPPAVQMTVNFYFRTDRCPQWGVVEDSITILSDFGQEPVTLPLVAIVEEDFSHLTPGQMQKAPVAALASDRVDLGHTTSPTGPLTARLTLTNRGGSPLKVRRIYVDDPGLQVRIKDTTVKKGKQTTLTIEVDPAGESVINKRFTLITNDPAAPTQVVRVVGTVAP